VIANLYFVKEIGRASKEGAGDGEFHGLRWADERALGAQEAPIGKHEQRPDQRVVRDRSSEGALGGSSSWPGAAGSSRSTRRTRSASAKAMRDAGLPQVRFPFDFEGLKVVVHA
jgi:hypothetical protein